MTQLQQPDLSGRTALVTGAGRGIGRATALALARCQAALILTARTEAEIQAVASEIVTNGGEAEAWPLDVSDSHQVENLFSEARQVDVLINNAGVVAPIGPIGAVDPDAWGYNIAVNLTGVFLTSHYAIRGMSERGFGRIINVSSGAARGSVTGWSAYSAAKAGVETLTKLMAQEVGAADILVNAVRPGIVDTEMQAELRASSEEQFGAGNLARYRGYKERGLLRDPEDPARLILWLLSAEANDVNGQVLAIDDEEVAARIGLKPMGR